MAASRPNRHRGKLIAVEGLDASGRSTQVALLAAWLRREGAPVSVCGAQCGSAPTPMAASLMQAAGLYECIDREILPLLKAGRLVCADGYATMPAAQDAARGLGRKWVRNLYGRAVAPALRLYCRLPLEAALRQACPPETAYPRLSGNAEENFRLYQGRIVEEMDRLAQELSFHVIDATQKPEDQQRQIREAVGGALFGKRNAAAT